MNKSLSYCLKCKRITETRNVRKLMSKNNRPMITGTCGVCGRKKSKFISSPVLKKGSGLFNTVLKNAPFPEMHLSLPSDVPGEFVENGSFNNTSKYSYCGPFTKVEKRISEGYRGVNDLDKACLKHDISYHKNKDTKGRNVADNELAQEANRLANDESQPDYVRKDAKKVAALMSTKSWLGMGIGKNKS